MAETKRSEFVAALDDEDDRLQTVLEMIGDDWESGDLTTQEAIAARISALEFHAEHVRALRVKHFGTVPCGAAS